MHRKVLILVASLTLITGTVFAKERRVLTEPREIRKFLRYHPDMTSELLLILAERPGTRISHATVDYITVIRESSEREYSCELDTTLTLTDGETLHETVEIDKLCEHLFN